VSSSGMEDNYPFQLGQYNYYMQQQPTYSQSQSSYRKFPQQPFNFSQNIEMPSFQNLSQNFPNMSPVSNPFYQQQNHTSSSLYFSQTNSQFSDPSGICHFHFIVI